LRSCDRSSWATARTTGPSLSSTRVRSASLSPSDCSTSKIASARVELLFACWPPGPLERENRNAISDRIDSTSMAAILVDVDGVLHVSGAPIAGAALAVRRLRDAGHRLRFVTNTTTRSRSQVATGLREMHIEVEDGELQTTGVVAARALKGKRVLALTMPGILDDLDGLQLVGMNVDAVLIGGADEGEETGRIFSYLNLNRAFHELDAGADLYCLHKNRWWQTTDGPRLDGGAFVAGLEYAADTEATVLGKPSAAYFTAALEALDAEAEMTWMIGDDLESDCLGAHRHGMKTVLVRTGKFRPDEVERSQVQPDAIVSSIAQLPDWLEANL
jgi:HAD superfamily hydrolase (TIGR01458 family)